VSGFANTIFMPPILLCLPGECVPYAIRIRPRLRYVKKKVSGNRALRQSPVQSVNMLGLPREGGWWYKGAVGPTVTDLAWAAGFLEGEGSFTFGSRAKRRPSNGSPQIHASQVQKEPLDRLQHLFGGGVGLYHKRGPNKNKSVYDWRVYGAVAIGVMLTLFRFMSPRRKAQMSAAILGWKLAPGQNKPWLKCKRGHDLTVLGARYVPKEPGKSGQCRICQRASAARRWREKSAA
jgi:hypothetical protein